VNPNDSAKLLGSWVRVGAASRASPGQRRTVNSEVRHHFIKNPILS
jgi:hypothetical protein